MEAAVLQQTTTIELSMIKRIAIEFLESLKAKIVNKNRRDIPSYDKISPESHGYKRR